MRHLRLWATATLLLAAGVWLAGARSDLLAGVDLRSVAYVGSEPCADCHADRHASRYRTWRQLLLGAALGSFARYKGKIRTAQPSSTWTMSRPLHSCSHAPEAFIASALVFL